MNDVRDAQADGNCTTGACDPSSPNRAPMSAIWRDALWRSNSDNIGDYWPHLCRELSDAERDAAIRSLAFNDINVATCVCTIKFAMAGSPDADSVVSNLQSFRDLALRRTDFGRRIRDLYYRHTAEMAGLMMKDADLRRSGIVLFRQAAGAYRALQSGASDTVLLNSQTADLARSFIARAQRVGSPALVSDLELVKPLIDEFEGVRVEEVRMKLGTDRRPK